MTEIKLNSDHLNDNDNFVHSDGDLITSGYSDMTQTTLNEEDSDEDNAKCTQDNYFKIHTKLLVGSGCCGNTDRIF
jgi:hypothetical protein